MLNRIKKILIALYLGAQLALPAFSYESTITYIAINNAVYEDVEIMIGDGAEMLVPFKQLANLFEIPFEANRVDKNIKFTTYDGKQGLINEQGVFIDEQKVQIKRPIFLKQGIMDNVMNEAFITSAAGEIIFGIKLETDYSSLTLNANVPRDIQILHTSENKFEADNGPKAYQDVILPKQNGKVSLNKISLNHNSTTNNMTTKDLYGIKDDYNNFSGNTRLTFRGKFMDGKYRIEANEYHYHHNAFMFGGLTATYANSFVSKNDGNKYYYEYGKVKGRTDIDGAIGTNIFGGQIWNYEYNKPRPIDLDGYVKPTSLVKVTIDNNEPVTLSTYSGYYTLADMQIPKTYQNIKIEEVNADGTVELIKEHKYSLYGDKPLKNESRSSAFAGVWGYQNRLFREGANIYRGNNKKVTAGVDYQYGIKDNLTFESRLTADRIYEKNNSSVIYTIPTNDTLLVTGAPKNSNYMEGITSLNSLEFVNEKNHDFITRITGGVSVARDVREEGDYRFGYTGKLRSEYKKDLTPYKWKFFRPNNFSANTELFHNSGDYYLASSDSTSFNGRTGAKFGGGFGFNSTNINGNYSKFFANLENKYEGGVINFDQFNINASTKIPHLVDVKFNTYYQQGMNDFGKNKNYNYDFNLSRYFGNWAYMHSGVRGNVYDTKYYNPTIDNRDYKSTYRDIYIESNIPIPGNHGKVQVGHNFVDYETSGYENNYRMFRFGYVFPTWKRLTLGLGYGFRYSGNRGHDFNVNLGYRAKSGQMMSVGYNYSKMGGYFIDNMFTPVSNRHSVSLIFNDAFQIFHHGMKSIGDEFENKGIFEAIAFIDVNKNGVYDKKVDIPLKDIPIVASWLSQPAYTNKAGKVSSASLSSGVYKVSLDMNSLPITVAPLTNDLESKTIKIDDGLTTKLELPLVSTVGSVSGVLKITDEFDRNLTITDFIVVLLDKDGNEVNYSTVDSSGQFYISGLEPGEYTLQLDERFISAYGLEEVDNSRLNISIPFDYQNPTDIMEQNLEYKTLSL